MTDGEKISHEFAIELMELIFKDVMDAALAEIEAERENRIT